MQSKYLFSLCLVVMITFIATENVVNGQLCSASTLISNFTSSQNVICPIGYAADILKLQCRPYDTVFDENYGKPCNSSKDCSLSFVCSSSQKVCVPFETRKLGEPCLAKESCIGSAMGCQNGVCASITAYSYDKKRGESCNYFDYSINKKYYCADSLICMGGICFERVNSGLGEGCSYNTSSYQYGECVSGTSCNYNNYKCIPAINNATLGDSCYSTSDISVSCLSPLGCISGKCYSIVYVGTGQPCYYKNTTSYTYSYCSYSVRETNICQGGICVRMMNSPIGGYCGSNSTHEISCSGSGVCFNHTCVPSLTSNEGGICGMSNSTGGYSCGSQLYCSGNNVCKKLGKKNEFCISTTQCQYGLTCLVSKCTNLNGKPVGDACFLNSECDSGLCLNSICSIDFNSTSCSSDSSCSVYDSKCSCGSGKASSNNYGTCVSMKRCKAYLSILYACLNNNARGIALSSVFDRNSPTHRTCAKEFSQYYSCLRVGLINAGSVPALSISGLDVNTDIDIDPSPAKFYKCNGYYSSDSFVCNGHGDCISDEVCKCYSGYYGTFCLSSDPPVPQPSKAPTPPIPPVKSIGNNNNNGGDRNGTNISNANTVLNNTLMISFNLMVMIFLCVIL